LDAPTSGRRRERTVMEPSCGSHPRLTRSSCVNAQSVHFRSSRKAPRFVALCSYGPPKSKLPTMGRHLRRAGNDEGGGCPRRSPGTRGCKPPREPGAPRKGIPAPTSMCVHATAPPPVRLGGTNERPAARVRRRSVVKMNYRPHRSVAWAGVAWAVVHRDFISRARLRCGPGGLSEEAECNQVLCEPSNTR